MKVLLRGILLLLGLLLVIGVLFVGYSRFLVDFSLENLEMTLAAANQDASAYNPSVRNNFNDALDQLVVDEIAKDQINLKDFAFLELALNSFEDPLGTVGYQKARVYLTQVKQSRLKNRPWYLRLSDAVYRQVSQFYSMILAFFEYVQREFFARFFKGTPLEGLGQPREIVDLSEIDQALYQKRVGKLEESLRSFRDYLKKNPDSPDRPAVTLSLAKILVQLQRYEEARNLLDQPRLFLPGRQEYHLALGLQRRIKNLQKLGGVIQELKQKLASEQAGSESLLFRLGLLYLSAYQFSDAYPIFTHLQYSLDRTIRERAVFCLGWLNNRSTEFGAGEEAMLNLIQDESHDRDVDPVLYLQLAELYSKRQEADKSEELYSLIAERLQTKEGKEDAAQRIWTVVAQLEKASLYFGQLNDPDRGRKILEDVRGVALNFIQVDEYARSLETSEEVNLRDLALTALKQKKVYEALNLLEKSMQKDPNDAWTWSAMGIAQAMQGNLDKALEFTSGGYFKSLDEYTASAYAYVLDLRSEFEDSITKYKEALDHNHLFLPARFNIGNEYIKVRQYAQALKLYAALFNDIYRNPSDQEVKAKILNNMAYALHELKYFDQTWLRLKQAVRLFPQEVTPQQNLKIMEDLHPQLIAVMREKENSNA